MQLFCPQWGEPMINLEYEEVLEQSRWYEKRPETSIPGRVFNFRVSMRIKVVRCQCSHQAAGVSRKYPFLTYTQF